MGFEPGLGLMAREEAVEAGRVLLSFPGKIGCCRDGVGDYSALQMSVPKQAKAVALLVLLSLLSGCGGISTGYGVSPASFLIPGLNVHTAPLPPSLPASELTPAR